MSRCRGSFIRVAPLGALLVLALSACGEAVENAPVARGVELCQNDFQTCVMPILSSPIKRRQGDFRACTDSACHVSGGNGGRFTLSFTDMDTNVTAIMDNFVNFTFVDQSPLLAKPTAGDPAFHGGDDIFPGPSDQCYVAIRSWLAKQVPTRTDAACGVCVSVANPTASCGFP
jgi:hypothetical protein